MVEKSLDLDKPWSCKWQKKNENLGMTTCMMIALRNKTVGHTFLPSFDNANSNLGQERLH